MKTPGETLQEAIDAAGVTQYALALAVKVPPRRINEIVKGQRAITADTALRLGRYFGSNPAEWLGLQVAYDLELTRQARAAEYDAIKPLGSAA